MGTSSPRPSRLPLANPRARPAKMINNAHLLQVEPLVNLATVPDSGDSDGAGAVVHGIDDAVIAGADAKVRSMACQRQEPGGPRISVPNRWRSRSVPRWLAVLFPDRAGSCPADAVRGLRSRRVHAAVCGGDGRASGPDVAGGCRAGQPQPWAGGGTGACAGLAPGCALGTWALTAASLVCRGGPAGWLSRPGRWGRRRSAGAVR